MARIRTIKPEFWQNEELANVSLHARLLAIALLNYADDSGCFYANPALVRAACFPFDDCSTNIRRSLDELSTIGYIQLKECSGKLIGKVLTFETHQRIDRPQKSKISQLFESSDKVVAIDNQLNTGTRRTFDEHSTNIRRTFDDYSSTGKEQGKEKEREQGKETTGNYAHTREDQFADVGKMVDDVLVCEEKTELIKIPDGIQGTPGGAASARPWDEKTVAECLEELRQDWQFMESLQRMYRIDASIIPEWMEAYQIWKLARDGPVARVKDVRSHFINWLRGRDLTKPAKVFKHESINNRKTNGGKAQHTGFDLLDAELDQIIQDQLRDNPIR